MNENAAGQTAGQPIDITSYTDYRPYLADLTLQKRKASGFSYRVFCRKSGFRSPSYLKWVIEGVRPISPKSVHKFIAGLSLDRRDAQYFMMMVNYKEAKDPQTKGTYYEQMLSWRQRHLGDQVKDAYEFLSHWYYLALRELVASEDFRDDPRWIRERLGGHLNLWEIRNGLETLERLRLIQRDPKRGWRQVSKDLYTEPEVKSLAAYSYHTEMLDLAQEALAQRRPEERHFQSLVALIGEETYSGLKERLLQFQQELVAYLQKEQQKEQEQEEEKKRIDNNHSRQELYAVNLHLLPLTVRRKGDL